MTISRRDALRLGATSAIGVVAGCASLGGQSERETDATDPIDTIPDGVTAGARTDVTALLNDDAVRRVVDAGLAPLVPWENGGGSERQSPLESISARTALAPEDAKTMVGFAKYRPDTDRRYIGLRIDAAWSTEALVDAFEQVDVSLTQHTYRDRSLYESADAGPSLGVIDQGSYAVGSRPAVQAAIDVDAGVLDPVSGDLRRRLAATASRPFGAAAIVPDEGLPIGAAGIGRMIDPGQFVALTAITAKAYREDDDVGTRVRLHAESDADAEDVKAAVSGALAGARTLARDGDRERALQAVSIERRGSTVVVDISGPADVTATVVDAAAEFLAELTGMETTAAGNASEP